MNSLKQKLVKLDGLLNGYRNVVVAFSGGTDSTFLLHRVSRLKGVSVSAFIEANVFYPNWETHEAVAFCKKHKIPFHVARTDVLKNRKIADNPPNRCYHCKIGIFSSAIRLAKKKSAIVLDGTNLNDMKDYRPGLKALQELGVRSPLKECGFTKEDIRKASRQAGLSTWKKPAMACLASRFPTGVKIDETGLKMVGKAEYYLWKKGFSQVRVRWDNGSARIEILPEEMDKVVGKDSRKALLAVFKKIGFKRVFLDLEGYRMGSMNFKSLSEDKKGAKIG